MIMFKGGIGEPGHIDIPCGSKREIKIPDAIVWIGEKLTGFRNMNIEEIVLSEVTHAVSAHGQSGPPLFFF